MTWYEIVIQYGIPIFSIIVSFVISFTKNKKVKKYANSILNITEVAKTFIVEAEKQKNYTGTEKKNFVMSRLLKFIFENSIKKVSEETLSDIIENEVALTNEVNVQKKQQPKLSTNTVSTQTQTPHTLKV